MIIKNGTLISPGTGDERLCDIRISDGLVAELGSFTECESEEVIDAGGCVVAPGFLDVHVHFRDPGQTWKEDLHTGARAAAAGGYTTVICMANTKPVVDEPEMLTELIRRAANEDIHIRFDAAISKGLGGQEATDFKELAQAGAWGFTDDGIPLLDEKFVEGAMQRAKELQLPLSFHEEHPAFIEKSGTHRTAPSIAEDIMVARDCMLSLHTNAPIDIQHISSGNSVALVRTAKALGAPVHAEATPHHFSLTEEAILKYGTYAKMNPPLRTEKDRQAIIEGLKDGTIDIIATDHAPHSVDEKHRADFFDCPSGIIGLETALALGVTNLVRPGHLTMMQLMEKMSLNPAKLYSMNCLAKQVPGKLICPEHASPSGCTGCPDPAHIPYGSILPGCAADLVIFCPDESFIAGNYQSKSENTPFTGMELYGKIRYTICNGRVVWKG